MPEPAPVRADQDAELREEIARALFERGEQKRDPEGWVSWADWLKHAEQFKGRAVEEVAAYRDRADAIIAGPLATLRAENDMLREIGRAASARWAEAGRLALAGDLRRIRRLLSAWDNPIRGSSDDPHQAAGSASNGAETDG